MEISHRAFIYVTRHKCANPGVSISSPVENNKCKDQINNVCEDVRCIANCKSLCMGQIVCLSPADRTLGSWLFERSHSGEVTASFPNLFAKKLSRMPPSLGRLGLGEGGSETLPADCLAAAECGKERTKWGIAEDGGGGKNPTK